MGRNLIETVMGAVVLIVAASFLFFAYDQSSVKTEDGYEVSARFDDVSGITPGSEVKIGGLKIGVVERLELDPETYQASAILHVNADVKLPKDSSAAVVSSGLLGDKFVKVDPGGDDEMMQEGDVIKFTQSSVSFEELIGKFVFSGGGVDGGETKGSSAPAKEQEGATQEGDNPFNLGF